MNKLKLTLIAAAAFASMALFVPAQVALADPAGEIQKGINQAGGAGEPTLGARFEDIVNVMLYIIGAIAVIMIVIGGIRYVTSNGDSGSVKSAKDTILYSVIGLIVAILAYSIVNFVVASF